MTHLDHKFAKDLPCTPSIRLGSAKKRGTLGTTISPRKLIFWIPLDASKFKVALVSPNDSRGQERTTKMCPCPEKGTAYPSCIGLKNVETILTLPRWQQLFGDCQLCLSSELRQSRTHILWWDIRSFLFMMAKVTKNRFPRFMKTGLFARVVGKGWDFW